MKKQFIYFSIFSLSAGFNINSEEKYICARGYMGDEVFTELYDTKEECNKYCTGIGTVCEKTGGEKK